jgi:hypothetical protein
MHRIAEKRSSRKSISRYLHSPGPMRREMALCPRSNTGGRSLHLVVVHKDAVKVNECHTFSP